MSKGPWDSYKKLVEIRHQMDEWMDASLNQLDGTPGVRADLASWIPPFDLVETDAELLLYGEVPGVSKPNLDVQLNGLELFIRGERQPDQASGGAYHLSERYYGSFQRTFKLPAPIDETAIATTLSDGILEIRLPKRKPRQIPIH